jgi:hypothetical protein
MSLKPCVPARRLRRSRNPRLGFVGNCPTSCRSAQRSGDLGRHGPAAAAERSHELRAAADVHGRRVLGERPEISGAAGAILVLARFDRLGNRDDVGGPARFDQLDDVPVDAAMVVAIEVGFADEVADPVECVVVEEQPADQRLLSLDRVRRDLQRQELRILGPCAAWIAARAIASSPFQPFAGNAACNAACFASFSVPGPLR